jgi:hypothetical protein
MLSQIRSLLDQLGDLHLAFARQPGKRSENNPVGCESLGILTKDPPADDVPIRGRQKPLPATRPPDQNVCRSGHTSANPRRADPPGVGTTRIAPVDPN